MEELKNSKPEKKTYQISEFGLFKSKMLSEFIDSIMLNDNKIEIGNETIAEFLSDGTVEFNTYIQLKEIAKFLLDCYSLKYKKNGVVVTGFKVGLDNKYYPYEFTKKNNKLYEEKKMQNIFIW